MHLAALASLEKVAVAQAEAFKSLAQAMQDYFDSFKAQGEPRQWASTDLTEWQKEQEELAIAAGMPAKGSERDRLLWLAQDMDA